MLDNAAPTSPTRSAALRAVEPGRRRVEPGAHTAASPVPAGPATSGPATPPRSPLVIRARLLAALDGPAALTVLRAPAGFGKTALLRHWCQNRPDVIWWTARVNRGADASRWPGPTDAAVTDGSATLVLDDADALGTGTPRETLELLRIRPGLRVILAGRGGSWFPDDLLADIGARVIRAEELLLTREETAQVLARVLPPPVAQGSYWADRVHRSTGGWPEITAAVARRMAVAAADPIELSAVASRTAAELLRGRLLPELKRAGAVDLAMVTAVADRFTAEPAGQVAGDGTAAAVLDRLVDDGLLVAETVGGQTSYHWPDAARRMLIEELTGRQPGRVTALHAAWARQYLERDRPLDAVQQAVAAQDWPLLVDIIDTRWRALLQDEAREVRDALMAIPAQVLAGSSRALALREILLSTPGPSAGLPPVQATMLPTLPALPASAAELARLATTRQLTEVLDGGLLVIAAHRHRGRHALALEHARRLLRVVTDAHATRPAQVARHRASVQLAVGVELMLTGDLPAAMAPLEFAHRLGAADSGPPGRFVASGAASVLAMLHALSGDVWTARRWLDRRGAIDVAQEGCSRAVTHLHVASAVTDLLLAVDEADVDAADAANRRLAVLDPASPWLDLWAFACRAQGQYALHRGDVHAALDRVARARATHVHDLGDDGVAAPLLAAAEADLLIAAGRAVQAQRCLRDAPAHGLLRVSAARLALLTGDAGTAIRLASDQAWESSAGTRDRVEMRLIRAIAAYRLGDLALATSALDGAARAARTAGLRSVWATVPRGELDDLARQVPAAAHLLPDPAPAAVHEVYPASAVLIDLTGRERAVLAELAAGATLESVAATLTISHNTVKTHVSSIYRKLAVDSRRAAVAAAQRLGLLSAPVG